MVLLAIYSTNTEGTPGTDLEILELCRPLAQHPVVVGRLDPQHEPPILRKNSKGAVEALVSWPEEEKNVSFEESP